MTTAANQPEAGDTAAWRALERAFRAFEEAWQRGERPAIEDHLPDGGHRRPALLELARIDLECRLRAGEAARAEDYLARYPELGEDGEAVLELVLVECRQRRSGPDADLAEYLQRFPALAAELQARLRSPSLAAAPPEPTETIPGVPRGPGETTEAAHFPRVPGYEVLAELGRGGMGIVYKARQLSLNRLVALKTIRGGPREEPEHLARLLAEARAVACLQHPNIVQIYEVGEQGDLPYLALELVEGGSLERKVGGSPQAPRWAAELVRVLARAVHAAHQAGVVHRDLKPANILLSADGAPKVTDFGLAKQLEAGPGRTHSGAVLGTPSYMAPEQAQGRARAVGPVTDVYGLGAVLYEVLTGRPPFRAETPLDTLLLVIAEEPVPPRSLNPKLPRDLETVCLKCLHKEPRERYPTALALADDLGRFLEGQPIRARPAGALERGWKWARRRPAAAALIGVVALALLALGAGALWYGEQRRQAQAQVLVEALAVAEPDRVPRLLEDLGPYRRQAGPLLRARAARADPDSAARLHLALALAPGDDGEAEFLAGRLLTAAPAEVGTIRDVLRPRADGLAGRYWAALQDPKAAAARRLRAACALAVYDPDNGRWADVSGAVVNALVRENLLLVPRWAEALRPVRGRLIPALAAVFRDAGRPEAERGLATTLLADYAADRPEVLADLAMDADARQFAVLYPPLQERRGQAVTALRAELGRRAEPRWPDAPLDPSWQQPGRDLVAKVEAGQGLLAERFAFCQALPLANFRALVEGLRPCGFRPIRFRPYGTGPAVLVAIVWARDGRAWDETHGATAEDMARLEKEGRGKGYIPADVAGYRTPEGERYAALWAKAQPGEEARLYAGVPGERLSAAQQPLIKEGFVPVAVQELAQDGASPRYSGVWGKTRATQPWVFSSDSDGTSYASACLDRVLGDVSLAPRTDQVAQVRDELLAWFGGPLPWTALALRSRRPAAPSPAWYAGIWHLDTEREALPVLGLDPAAHLARCRQLAAEGYRPAGLAVAGGLAASVWHRPLVPDGEKERLAKRQASAAAALLRLGEDGPVWPLLKHSPDPRVRSYLIHRLSPLGADARAVVRRLAEEPDVSVKRALLLALGEFGEAQLPPAEWDALVPAVLGLYRDNPDPGLHGAAEWLLRQWGQGAKVREIDRALATGKVEGQRRWYITGQGQTMVVVLGPVEFLMGSPPTEADREDGPEGKLEEPHRVRIGRSFALAAEDVTVEQFLRFRKDHGYNKTYAPKPDCPINTVTWYEAAEYCNWLSKQEDIPADQWCYEPNGEGNYTEGMRARPNYLSLTGYRLPTESEWEYACRAGAVTSRYYGETEELLGHYAWYTKVSQDRRMLPVGSLKPNDLGLFDMLGNALQWCHDPILYYQPGYEGRASEDREFQEKDIKDKPSRVTRGSALADLAMYSRSAFRGRNAAGNHYFKEGFRPARTFR